MKLEISDLDELRVLRQALRDRVKHESKAAVRLQSKFGPEAQNAHKIEKAAIASRLLERANALHPHADRLPVSAPLGVNRP